MSTSTAPGPRTRQTDERVPIVPHRVDYSDENGTSTSVRTYDWFSVQGSLKTVTDVVTPDFRNRVKAGEIIMNPFELVQSTWESDTCSGDYSGPDFYGPVHVSGDASATLMFATGDWSQLWQDAEAATARSRDVALVKAYAKLHSPGMDSGEAIVTLNQTIGMLREPLHSTAELLHRMVRKLDRRVGRRPTPAAAAKAIADIWLEYRYGWKPLLMDCDNAIMLVMEHRQRVFKERRVTRAKAEYVYEYSRAFEALLGTGLIAPVYGTRLDSVKVESFAGIMYEQHARTTREVCDQALGQRPRDMVSSFWELIPYSFVADWFVNVGDWLQAVVPDPTVDVLASWVTTKRHFHSEIIDPYGFLPALVLKNKDAQHRMNFPDAKVSREDVTRVVNPVLPNYPVLNGKPISTLHSVDAVSLLLGPITRLVRRFAH